MEGIEAELLPCPLCQAEGDTLLRGVCYPDGSIDKEAAVMCPACGCRATLKAWQSRPRSYPVTPGAFHPDKNLPDCMMPDGGECCAGHVALVEDWHKQRREIERLRGVAQAAGIRKALENIEYVLRKDSLTDNERVESARIGVQRLLASMVSSTNCGGTE